MQTPFHFPSVIELATSVQSASPDDRPQALKDLRDAVHPTTLYYRFLYELCTRYTPVDVLEIGTFCGTSAAHMAWNNGGHVITVDIQPDAKAQVDRIGRPNIRSIVTDSSRVIPQLEGRTFDVIYIDGWHDFNQTYGEYVLFRPLLRDGGLMIIDDVGLEMEGDQMEVFWEFVGDAKQRVDHLHPNTGFGIVQKTAGVQPRPWKDVIGEAQARMLDRKAGRAVEPI